MDFFEQQDVARRKTGRLVFVFVLAVVVIILAVYLVVAALVGAAAEHTQVGRPPRSGIWQLWNPELLLWVGLGTVAVITLGSLLKIAELSSGGETVALMLGGRLIQRQTGDLGEQRVLNVVEEMALAAGVPVPPVYVLENEPSINAFAAGHHPADAVVAVSRGCLSYLTRDELQGVVGHEFSHILNGDMRLNLRLIGILNGILFLAILGYYMMRIGGSVSSDDDNKKGGGIPLVVLGLGILVIGYIGVFFAKLIKSGVSRQREYLADASSVQFTRYPPGIAGALKKIGGLEYGSRIKDKHAQEVSHMFFGDAFAGTFFNLFATHPPLEKRIARLDPSFDGVFPEVQPLDVTAATEVSPEQARRRREFLGAVRASRGGGPQVAASSLPLGPAGVVGRVGAPGMAQILLAGALLDEMPQPLRAATGEPYSARAVIYAVLLDRGEEIRQKQLQILQGRIEQPSYRQTTQMMPLVDRLSEEARLPLVHLALPALKGLSPAQYASFRENVQALIEADAKVSLFEYAVRTMLLRNLDVHFGLSKPASPRYAALAPLMEPLWVVLSTLAYAGQEAEGDAQRAFELAAKQVGMDMPLASPEDCTLAAFDKAAEVLAEATPPLKKQIMSAAIACIAADGKVTVKESELIRAISATLGCPIPPILPDAAPDAPSAV